MQQAFGLTAQLVELPFGQFALKLELELAHGPASGGRASLHEFNLIALPVPQGNRKKGIITVDDIIDIVDEEASQDIGAEAGRLLGRAFHQRIADRHCYGSLLSGSAAK